MCLSDFLVGGGMRVLLVLFAVWGCSGAWAQALTPAETALLLKGEPVVRVTRDLKSQSLASGQAFAAIDIPAPADAVFRTLRDCNRIVRFLKNVVSCKILKRDPAGTWELRETIVTISQMLPNFRAVARADYTIGRQIRFKQVEGSFDYLEGQWDLAPFRNGLATRAFYKVRAGTSVPVPEFMIQNLIQSDLPETLKRLRAEVIRGSAQK